MESESQGWTAAQLVNTCFEDVNPIPSTYVNIRGCGTECNSTAGMQRQEDLWGSLASQAEWVSSEFSERLSQNPR